MRTRFAPSPTGPPHLGSLHTALFAFLAARHAGGTFIIRIDDTDVARSKPEWERDILSALKYIGMTWDEGPYRQSERGELYGEAIDRLKGDGFLYPCFCTENDLDLQRAAAKAAGRPYVYDGRCRSRSRDEMDDRLGKGERCVWRFHADPKRLGETVAFRDLVWGDQIFRTELIGDFVCIRGDGKPTYMLVSPLDDVSMGITHVIRGADHLPNTPSQILVLRALGHEPPEFGHLPLIVGVGGKKLSKRDELTGLDDIRRHLPQGLVNHLALLGWTHPDGKETLSLDEIESSFGFDRVSTSPAAHDPARLAHLEREHLARMSPQEMIDAWKRSAFSSGVELDDGRTDCARIVLGVVGDEITSLESIGQDVIPLTDAPAEDDLRKAYGEIEPEKALTVLERVLETSPDARMDVIRDLASQHGKKHVYMPLRLALTGRQHGYELSKLMQAFGAEEIDRRLESARRVLREMIGGMQGCGK